MPSRLPLLFAFAFAIPAHADIVKCQDGEGNVTLTDVACPAGARMVQVVTKLPPPPTVAPRLAEPPPDERGIARVILKSSEFAQRRPAVPRRQFIPPTRLFSTDAATLKAARMALILGDSPEKVAGR